MCKRYSLNEEYGLFNKKLGQDKSKLIKEVLKQIWSYFRFLIKFENFNPKFD
jgi:hypothetical protein